MSGRVRIETFKRDNALVDIIYQHKGKANAIGTQALKRALNEKGFKVKADSIHQIVKKVMVERRLPICAAVNHGYYWGISKQDIDFAVNELKSKIYALQERCELLESFICK